MLMIVLDSNDDRASADSDARSIRELTMRWTTAVKAQDIDRLLSLVTDDVVFLPPGGAPIRGKQAVGDLYRLLFAQFDVEQSASAEEIEVSGDWAFSWGAEVLTLSPRTGGQPIRMRGRGLTILRRQPDESWRFARGINNSAPETATEG
jgi:uncharacterized protein (TIGR02246 family)